MASTNDSVQLLTQQELNKVITDKVGKLLPVRRSIHRIY
jgi:hypothetical protein